MEDVILKKVQYITEEDKENIIRENSDLILIEIQNHLDGNFLIFSDEPLPQKEVYINVPKEEFELTANYMVDLDYRLSLIELGLSI